MHVLQAQSKGIQKKSNLLGWTFVRLYRLEMLWHSVWLILEIVIRCYPPSFHFLAIIAVSV